MRNLFMATVAAVALTVPATAGDDARITDTEIPIGTYTDMSGVTAVGGSTTSMPIAWRLMRRMTQAVSMVAKSSTSSRTCSIGAPCVQADNKLLNLDSVFINVSNAGTPMNNATMPDAACQGRAEHLPVHSGTSMYTPLNHMKFGYSASYYDMERAGVKLFAEQHGKKRFCAMSQDTDYGRDVMDGARDELKALNLQLVAETLHKPTDTDFSAAVAKLRDADCDMVCWHHRA